MWGLLFDVCVCVPKIRLGRWWRLKEAKNGLYIIPLKRKDPEVPTATDAAEEVEQEER